MIIASYRWQRTSKSKYYPKVIKLESEGLDFIGLKIPRDYPIDSEEKSGEYTEIHQAISHMGSRMRESRTSGSERGMPCKGHISTLPSVKYAPVTVAIPHKGQSSPPSVGHSGPAGAEYERQ